eukprot:scaffold255252_cov30-Tisochrysis_lutea.AAC.2
MPAILVVITGIERIIDSAMTIGVTYARAPTEGGAQRLTVTHGLQKKPERQQETKRCWAARKVVTACLIDRSEKQHVGLTEVLVDVSCHIMDLVMRHGGSDTLSVAVHLTYGVATAPRVHGVGGRALRWDTLAARFATSRQHAAGHKQRRASDSPQFLSRQLRAP